MLSEKISHFSSRFITPYDIDLVIISLGLILKQLSSVLPPPISNIKPNFFIFDMYRYYNFSLKV